MNKFGMGSTLISFKDQFYEYGGSVNPINRCLPIGGYKSVWIADGVASWIIKKNKDLFENILNQGIYRDDGLGVFKAQ